MPRESRPCGHPRTGQDQTGSNLPSAVVPSHMQGIQATEISGCIGIVLNVRSSWEGVWDDAAVEALRPELVKQAREEQIEYFRKTNVYTKVPISECTQVAGKLPIGVRWVEVNKQDEGNPKYRSRVVAK